MTESYPTNPDTVKPQWVDHLPKEEPLTEVSEPKEPKVEDNGKSEVVEG